MHAPVPIPPPPVLCAQSAAGPLRLRLALLGSGEFALPSFCALAQQHDIRLVVTQPDKPAGRGQALTPTPVGQWAAAAGLPLAKPVDINAAADLAHVRSLAGPDLVNAWVIIAFGQKLSVPLLDGLFAVNLHGSLLPRWRGAAPINAAMLAGDPVTGNTVITIAQRMDAGLMLGQSQRPILPNLSAGELHDLLAADGPALLADVLTRYAAGSLTGRPQDENLTTRARKLSKADAFLDFTQSAEVCRRRVHGLNPWPAVTVTLADKPCKLLRVADLPTAHSAAPGTLLTAQGGLVACGAGALQILEIQPAGGTPMPWRAFFTGRRPADGALFTSQPPPRPEAKP
ncbi:MAG: methionyl-tRNA formyltransferase [Planctomycetaceae bacterium]|jgi:methionyl-tRNA formyltransferase|nr:methionyl-tRNA formyltransferase [Phycisphaerales bacterium]MCE2654020.1 methionyl-tRNA formyltransferase [Planctomycetaceae bacterium]